MEAKLQIVLLSHLGDVQIDGNMQRVRFAKYLILKYPNTDIYIDPDKEYEKFLEREESVGI